MSLPLPFEMDTSSNMVSLCILIISSYCLSDDAIRFLRGGAWLGLCLDLGLSLWFELEDESDELDESDESDDTDSESDDASNEALPRPLPVIDENESWLEPGLHSAFVFVLPSDGFV